MARLGIIIVSYNTGEVLQDCLNNLKELDLADTEVIVVDNGSKDGSSDMVEREFKEVRLIRTENRGLAAGYNLGLSYTENCDYTLFLGPDSFPRQGCVEGVIGFMENNSDAGVATAKLVLRNEALDMDAHRGFPTPWTALTHFAGWNRWYFMRWCNMDKPHEIDLCISHFMMVRKEVLIKVGRWDEDFFVYGEDVDFCWRVKRSGFKIMYLPQFECLHYKGVSVGTRKESSDVSKADNETKKRMKLETTRAMRLFYKKHMYNRYPWILNKTVDLGISVMELVRK